MLNHRFSLVVLRSFSTAAAVAPAAGAVSTSIPSRAHPMKSFKIYRFNPEKAKSKPFMQTFKVDMVFQLLFIILYLKPAFKTYLFV